MQPATITIEAGRPDLRYWHDLWRSRELLLFLAWRDILLRYRQTTVGVLWSILRPLLTMIVLTFVFSRIAKLSSAGIPYGVLVLAGLVPWQLFSAALSNTSGSLVGSAGLISKVYFPRLVIPLSRLIGNLVDFGIAGVLLVVLMGWFGVWPGWRIVLLPWFTLLALAAALGVGLWFGALNVKYRDFGHIVPFIAQFGLYISPVGYASGVVPDQWRLLFSLNPMVGVIDGFRYCLLPGNQPLYWPAQVISTVTIGAMLWAGVRHFRRTERSFADVI
ncbi:MAG: ABC transporter permease [Phycisphaerae bacterium]|jgi:lipopolysaccharide transport system permease protein